MQCLKPIYVHLTKESDKLLFGTDMIPVPCGKCLICKSNRRQEFATRLQVEADSAKSTWFGTLTYSDDYLPYGDLVEEDTGEVFHVPVLRKSDIQHYFMRLRTRLWRKYGKSVYKEFNLKYFAVGEYGSNPVDLVTFRPHWHFVLLNLPDDDINLLDECWQDDEGNFFGTVEFRPGELNAFAYCGKYMLKPPNLPSYYKGVLLSSKGIGLGYLTESRIKWHKADLKNRRYIRINGYKVNMPRYLRNKIYDDREKRICLKYFADDLKNHNLYYINDELSVHGAVVEQYYLQKQRERRILINFKNSLRL